MLYQFLSPVRPLMKRRRLSERQLASNSGVSRSCLREIVAQSAKSSINSIVKVCEALGLSLTVIAHPDEINSEYSVVAVGYTILKDGRESWRIHLFNMVDEFRRTQDPRLFLLPPPRTLDQRLRSLLAAVVRQLCIESDIEAPAWARNPHFLPDPWFVSDIDALKASALLESPLAFRMSNIFVQSNFLDRA